MHQLITLISLLTLLHHRLFSVNAGLCMWSPGIPERLPPSLARRYDAMTDSEIDCCETYLWRISINPMSLKQLCRINIRNQLIARMRDFYFVKHFILPTQMQSSQSILHNMVIQLDDLPRTLHSYLYEFPDVPCVSNDIDVFVNY